MLPVVPILGKTSRFVRAWEVSTKYFRKWENGQACLPWKFQKRESPLD